MGLYLNIGNEGFRISRNSEYVDKSELIDVINSMRDTERGATERLCGRGGACGYKL